MTLRAAAFAFLAACLSALVFTPLAQAQAQVQSITGSRVSCSGGEAAGFACASADLLSVLQPIDVGAAANIEVNDLWGWTDPETGREYALVGRQDGTGFVDVTDPVNPVYLGELPRHAGTPASIWRDLKTYQNYVYVVADGAGFHGLQVFDLHELRNVQDAPVTFEETAHYGGFASAHNVVINEDSGFLYAVGASGNESCGGGLHMVNIQIPETPRFVGCFADTGTGRAGTGYTHDAQCVNYHGPDPDYTDAEICFGGNETHISIADVTDKANPWAVARASYPNVGYTHQGWLTEDHRYFVVDDELDEGSFGFNTRTLIWDVQDLDDPVLIKEYFGADRSYDHNLYIVGDYVFQANYNSGMRILDISDIENPTEVAFFDTSPRSGPGFGGAWSVYPFFKSGNVLVTSGEEGLFVIQPLGLNNFSVATQTNELPEGFVFETPYPNPFQDRTTTTLAVPETQRVTVRVYDMLGRVVAQLHEGLVMAGQPQTLTFDAAHLPPGTYVVRAEGAGFTATRILTRVP